MKRIQIYTRLVLMLLLMMAGAIDAYAVSAVLTTNKSTVQVGENFTLTSSVDADDYLLYDYLFTVEYYVSDDATSQGEKIYTARQHRFLPANPTLDFVYLKNKPGEYYFHVDITRTDEYDAFYVKYTSDRIKVDVTGPAATLSASATNVNAGEEITLNATTPAGSPTYTFYCSTDNGNSYSLLETTSSHSIKYRPANAGTYMFKAGVSSNGYNCESEPVTVTAQEVTPYLIASISPTQINPCHAVTIKATPICYTPESYVYYYSKDGSDYTQIETSTNNTCTFTPTTAGTYTFKVMAGDKEATSSSLNVIDGTLSFVFPPVQQTVNEEFYICACAQDFTPTSVTYYYKMGEGDWITLKTEPYDGTLNYISFKPTEVGTYYFKLTGTDGTYTVTSEEATVEVIDLPATMKLTTNCSDALTYEPITLTATSNHCTPESYAYSYSQNGSDFMAIETTADNTCTFTPVWKGTYVFQVTATVMTDEGSSTVTSNTALVEVSEVNPYVTLTANPTEILLGDTITLTAKPVCCAPTFYDFYYNDDQTNISYDWIERTTVTTCKFVPKKVGTYKLSVMANLGEDYNWLDGDMDGIITVSARPTQTLTTNASGVLSCTAQYPLDFSSVEGLKAYVATGMTSSVITLQRVNKVQKGEAFIVLGDASTEYDVPSVVSVTHPDGYTNLFKSADGTKKAKDYAAYVYCLNTSGNFQQVDDDVVIPSGKAYLATSVTSAKILTLNWLDVPTDINAISEMSKKGDNVIYNISGQRQRYLQKGINIINGKKIIR